MLKSSPAVILIFLLASCTASRKFDFNSAYKFSYLRYHPSPLNDSVPPLMVSSDHQVLTPSGQPVIPDLEFQGKTIPINKKTMQARVKKPAVVKHVFRNSDTVEKYTDGETEVIPLKTFTGKHIKHHQSTAGFSDLHPAFQGFIFVALGFGLIVAGSVIIGVQVIPVVLIVGGIALAVYGFVKILSQL